MQEIGRERELFTPAVILTGMLMLLISGAIVLSTNDDDLLYVFPVMFGFALIILLLYRVELGLMLFPLAVYFAHAEIGVIGTPEKLLTLMIMFGTLPILPSILRPEDDKRSGTPYWIIFLMVYAVSVVGSTIGVNSSLTMLTSIMLKSALAFIIYRLIDSYSTLKKCFYALTVLQALLVITALSVVIYFDSPHILRDDSFLGVDLMVKGWSGDSVFGFADFTPLLTPNMLARVLSMGMPITYWAYNNSKSKSLMVMFQLLFVASFMVVALTFSRSGLIEALLAIIMITVLMKGRFAKAVIILAVATIVVMVLEEGFLLERLQNLTSGRVRDEARYKLLQGSVESILDHPVLGTGPGSSPEQIFYYTGYYIRDLSQKIAGHNMYLNIIIESGVMGFVPFMASLGIMYKRLYQSMGLAVLGRRDAAKAVFIAVTVGLLSALFAPLITENYLWYYLGLALATIKVVSMKAEDEEPGGVAVE